MLAKTIDTLIEGREIRLRSGHTHCVFDLHAMFGDLRGGRRREISGEGGDHKKSDGGKKGENQEFFFEEKHNTNTTPTNTKALSSGSRGSSNFTAIGCLAVPLGVDVAVERVDML